MKNAFLLIVILALFATLGFAQAPDAGSNTNVANVSGCLGGSEGAYTVTEDGTRQVFKITTSSVDLKPHVGHDVKLTGQNPGVAATPGAADHSFAVTELSMISEHCAAAAAATAGAAVPYAETVVEPAAPAAVPTAPPATPAAPSVTTSSPAPDAAAPATTASAPAVEPAAPAAAVSTPPVEAAAPAAVVSPSAPTVSTPPVEAAEPAATLSPSAAAVKAPGAKAAHPAPPAHARKGSAADAAAEAAIAPTEPVNSTPEPTASAAADAATAVAAVNPSPEAVPAPDPNSPDAVAPAPPATHRAGSLSLLVAFVVLVIVLGVTAPLIGRWRKRKSLERDGSPNLSFTNDLPRNEAGTDEVTARKARSAEDTKEPRKVA